MNVAELYGYDDMGNSTPRTPSAGYASARSEYTMSEGTVDGEL